nr:hypothetical protein [uncultured Actinoplanes sp.]
MTTNLTDLSISVAAFHVSWNQRILYLILAALALLMALRFVKRALAPIGVFVQAVAAAAAVAFLVTVALVLVAVAALSAG